MTDLRSDNGAPLQGRVRTDAGDAGLDRMTRTTRASLSFAPRFGSGTGQTHGAAPNEMASRLSEVGHIHILC